MRKLVVVLTATGAILLASSVAWKADAQTAPGTGTIFEVVLKPCDPGVPRNQCGISLKLVHGHGTFTTTTGEAIDMSQEGQVVNVNGNSVVTQSNQANSILNFASAGQTTGSIGTGIGGGGGGTTGSLGAYGGTNNGPTGPTRTANVVPTGLGLGSLTGSVGVSSPGITTSVTP